MKKKLLIYSLLMAAFSATAQEYHPINETTAEQLEARAAASGVEIKDDSYLQQLDHFRRHPQI